MAGGSGKLRHACNECHRMKIRCSGENPCEGCVNSRTACCYSVSGRLGRPKGTKNKRTLEDGEAKSSQRPRGPDRNRLKNDQESRQQSPPRQETQFINHHSGPLQSPTRTPTLATDDFVTTQETHNPLLLDTAIYDNPYDIPFNLNDTRLLWDTPNFDLPQSVSTEKTAQDHQASQIKDPFGSNDVTMDDILPQAFWMSSYPSPRDSLSKVPTLDMDSMSSTSNLPYTKPSSPQHYVVKPASPQDRSAKLNPTHPPTSQPSYVSASNYQQTLAKPAPCNCFQQHADLLVALKSAPTPVASGAIGQEPSLGSLLPTVQDALKAWRSLIECRTCSANAEHEVLLLALMTMRILLLRVQAQMPNGSDRPTPSPSRSPDPQRRQALRPQGRQISSPSRSTNRVKIGDHELGATDGWLVTQFMLLSTVRRIKAAVQCFQEMLERKTKPTMGPGGTLTPAEFETGYDHVAQMLRSLIVKVAGLEKGLERGC